MACASSSLIADWDAAGAAKMVNKLAAVVDAVEVDRLAIVISPRTVRGRSQSGHLSKRRPAIDVRPPTTNPRLGRSLANNRRGNGTLSLTTRKTIACAVQIRTQADRRVHRMARRRARDRQTSIAAAHTSAQRSTGAGAAG